MEDRLSCQETPVLASWLHFQMEMVIHKMKDLEAGQAAVYGELVLEAQAVGQADVCEVLVPEAQGVWRAAVCGEPVPEAEGVGQAAAYCEMVPDLEALAVR